MTVKIGALRRPLGASSARSRAWQHGDLLYRAILLLAGLGVIVLMLAIGWELWTTSELSRSKFGLDFLFSSAWDPALTDNFGAFPYILGTLVSSAIAVAIAVPISLGTAIFLAELAPGWIAGPVSTLVELLAAVPSVVYGIWALFVLVPVIIKPLGLELSSTLGFIPLFAGPVFGPSRLAAGVILAIMILPTITAISRDVLRVIPGGQREASLALGATRWETLWKVMLPYGRSGILGAIVLGLGRALGETIAVTMVIGNNLDLSPSLLHPGYTMASIIANEFTEATFPLYTSALVEIGLVLFVFTLIINIGAQLLVWRVRGARGSV
jgi:phosphate transport system permease protein